MLAALHAVGTAGVELTALRRICRGRDRAFQHDTVHFRFRIRDRNCREQGFRVRMQRITENIFCRSVLYQITQIHNTDSIRNIFDYRQVMGNEQVGQVVFFLQLL